MFLKILKLNKTYNYLSIIRCDIYIYMGQMKTDAIAGCHILKQD